MDGETLKMLHEKDHAVKHEIIMLAPNGLGYGEGTISTEAQLKTGELRPELLKRGIEIISEREEVFVDTDPEANDDGCGDGRPAGKIFRVFKRQGEKVIEEYKRSLRRAKVFGGGLIVASSMWRVLKGQPSSDESVFGDRELIAGDLHALDIAFGAHVDNHAAGENCGCGAIDRYPDITRNIVNYREQITGTLEALYDDEYDASRSSIETVFNYYETLVGAHPDFFRDANGAQSMRLIEDKGAVIKELVDAHEEDIIVVNDIDGTTFDQRAFDAVMMEEFGEDAPAVQVFAVDTWRGRMYADALVQIAGERLPELDGNDVRQWAYADFLIRTLAVAATLTGGDLPTLGRVYKDKAQFALEASALAA